MLVSYELSVYTFHYFISWLMLLHGFKFSKAGLILKGIKSTVLKGYF